MMDLAGAIATYGYYANELFGYNSSFTPHALFDDSGLADITAANVSVYAPLIESYDGSVNYYGSSLLLQSETAIRHYFTLSEGKSVDDYTFLLGEGNKAVPLEPQSKGGMIYVEISGIPSPELADTLTVTVLDAQNGNTLNTITYSAFSYIYKALSMYEAGSPDISGALANTVKALALYSYAADSYFDSLI